MQAEGLSVDRDESKPFLGTEDWGIEGLAGSSTLETPLTVRSMKVFLQHMLWKVCCNLYQQTWYGTSERLFSKDAFPSTYVSTIECADGFQCTER